jgi:hypothetical protein
VLFLLISASTLPNIERLAANSKNATAQYSSANMMVITRSVTDESVGSGE